MMAFSAMQAAIEVPAGSGIYYDWDGDNLFYVNWIDNSVAAGDVVIPDTVTIDGYDYTPQYFGQYANFWGNANITSLTIKAPVAEITGWMCQQCTGLAKVTIGEGKLHGAQENDFYYLLGVAHNALGDNQKARQCWNFATQGPQEPAAAMYYNDAKPDKIFYQGLALRALGREDEAHGRFYKLINYGKQHVFEKQIMDYFAVSLPDLLIWEDSLDMKNLIHCKYMLALGYYGMGETDKALRYLDEVEELDNNHQGIQQFRTLIDSGL